jgi:hypothetical protein
MLRGASWSLFTRFAGVAILTIGAPTEASSAASGWLFIAALRAKQDAQIAGPRKPSSPAQGRHGR